MKRSEVNPMPQFFDRYINLVEDIDIVEALEKYNSIETLLDKEQLEKLGSKVYAPGKWSVKQIIQHITDNERVQAYRALRIARNDKTILPGYDEELFAANVHPEVRGLDDLLQEFTVVRRSNIILFENFSEEVQQRVGNCNNINISVLGLGFQLVGHLQHHVKIIKEKYLPLIVGSN
jgi:hypothetical protein